MVTLTDKPRTHVIESMEVDSRVEGYSCVDGSSRVRMGPFSEGTRKFPITLQICSTSRTVAQTLSHQLVWYDEKSKLALAWFNVTNDVFYMEEMVSTISKS